MRIGVVSDTHGLLRPEVASALAGVERILHLGDVGKFAVIEELGKIAPVTAVRGNVDRDGACGALPETEVALIEGRYVYMLHDLKTLHLDPAAGKFAAVLSGHTHVPNFYRRKGVLYFNPGSCGPRRFELPVTVGLLTTGEAGEFEATIVTLDERGLARAASTASAPALEAIWKNPEDDIYDAR
jgi:putative phosphoesterase